MTSTEEAGEAKLDKVAIMLGGPGGQAGGGYGGPGEVHGGVPSSFISRQRGVIVYASARRLPDGYCVSLVSVRASVREGVKIIEITETSKCSDNSDSRDDRDNRDNGDNGDNRDKWDRVPVGTCHARALASSNGLYAVQ